ncbi:Dolichyl-phosphate-mannose-protein mannosyltransferase [Candidatus Electronema halotolerans]
MPFPSFLHRLLPSACIFLCFLFYFVFSTGWLEPAKLVLRGQALTADHSPQLTVRWDSGHGFNNYEQRLFQPDIVPQNGQVKIRFGAAGRCYPASQSKQVVCAAVRVDSKKIDFHDLAKQFLKADSELHFGKHGVLALTVQSQSHIAFKFRTDTSSGVAFVEVNGKRTEYDLYMANVEATFKQLDFWLLQPDGSFQVETDLPRYPIRKLEIVNSGTGGQLRLTAAELHGKGKVVDLLHGQPAALGRFSIDQPLQGMRSFFQPLQFVQQIIFALLSTWLLIALTHRCKAAGSLRSLFCAEKRHWFWLMLTGSLTIFSLWLAAFWPGVLSVDSMKIWRAAVLPDVYLNDHPLLNVFLYKYLYHLWHDPAVVPVVHVLLTSLLAAWFGFWLHRQGAALPMVLLWLLFLLCSVPVGVYNVMLWKDVPFALLTVFWACILVKLRQEKQQRLRWTGQRICALLLAGISLGLIRHNGLVYLAVLPALLLLLRLVLLKKALLGLIVLLTVAGLGFAVLQQAGKTKFLDEKLHQYTKPLSLQGLAQDAVRTAQDYMTVLNINQPYQKWDKFHHYFQDRQAWWFLRLSGWQDVYPYQKTEPPFPALNSAALHVYEKSYDQPWVWLTWNPVWLLALLPLLTLLCRWLPNTAVLGAVLLAGALPLVYLRIFNWRYYYFLYFGLLFLPAFILLDCTCREFKRQR